MTSVTITNKSDKPFTVFPPESVSGNAKMRFDMKKKRDLKPGEDLELKVFVTPNEAGAVQGQVRVKTSTKEKPQLELSVWGQAFEADAVHSSVPTPSKSDK